ncbi:MAG: hypothetical protein P8176_04980 [Gammaproteobacteria bacterium]
MAALPASLVVELADDIYGVYRSDDVRIFLARKEFSQQIAGSRILKAEVGTRLINTRDAFGVCARGSGQYANDLFLMFRGTTGSNYGADIFTDLRTGLNVGVTGALVHSGFNHAFNI